MGRKDITILMDIRTAEYTMFEVNGKRPGKMGAIHKITHFVELVE